MEKIILGFVGEISSGKGTACDYLIKKYNAGYYRFSTIMRDLLDRLHKEQSRENMQLISTVLRQNFGEDLFAKVMSEDAKGDLAEIVCVDGIRRPADIIYLKKLPNFKLIYITADEVKRFERVTRRSENTDDKGKTFADFQREGQNETELLIKEVAADAEYTIENNGTIDDLYTKIEEIIQEIKKT